MSDKPIQLDTRGPIARLTLDRPDERNAMSPEMGAALRDAVAEVNDSPAVRVLVVRGAGKAFSAGGNLDNLEAEARGERDRGLGGGANFYRRFLSIRAVEVPTIAAINGHAIGAGLCFALAHDLRVVHEKARLGMTFVRLGIHPGMAATWTLPRLIGSERAADLLYTGRLVDGREAVAMGLAGRVGGDDFDDVVEELAEQIASSGPIAVRAVKRTLRRTFERPLDDALEVEAAAQAMTFTTQDALEGIQAVREKRSARFRGR